MPELVAPDASSVSPPSLAGGDGALQLSDEDILGISPEDASTQAPAAPAVEEPAPAQDQPIEAKPAEVTAPEEEVDDLKWMRPLLNDKAFGPKLQSMHDRLLAFQELYPKVADARAVKELLPGGLEELKQLQADKRDMDDGDLQFFSGDIEQQRPYLQNLQKENPDAFQSAVQVGLELIKAQAPQEWAYLTGHLVGESLIQDKVWDWLEYLHENAVSRPEDMPKLLNQFAQTFQKYGLGPREDEQDPNLQRIAQARGEFDKERAIWNMQRQKEFNGDTEKSVTAALDSDISGQLTKLLPKTSDSLRGRISRDVHSEIQKVIGADAGLKLRLANLMRTGGINRQTQEQVANLLISKARQIMPGAVKRVVGEYTASVMASRQEVTTKQNQAATRVDVSSGAKPNHGAKSLTQEEANSMTFEDVLSSSRPVARR